MYRRMEGSMWPVNEPDYWRIEAHVGEYIGTWSGGPYIDVYERYDFILNPDDRSPIDTINVWDYAKEKPRIARTPQAAMNEIRSWLKLNS